jgi:hypothetical protein
VQAEIVDYLLIVVYSLPLTPPAANRLALCLASSSLTVVHLLNQRLSDRMDVFSFWTACRLRESFLPVLLRPSGPIRSARLCALRLT